MQVRQMGLFVEDFSAWETGALVTVPPESYETADLVALVIELQNRLVRYDINEKQASPHR